jgi:hypothetical protein
MRLSPAGGTFREQDVRIYLSRDSLHLSMPVTRADTQLELPFVTPEHEPP